MIRENREITPVDGMVAEALIDFLWGKVADGIRHGLGINITTSEKKAFRGGDLTKYTWTIINPADSLLAALEDEALFTAVPCGFLESYHYPVNATSPHIEISLSKTLEFSGDTVVTIDVTCDRGSLGAVDEANALADYVRHVFEPAERQTSRGSDGLCQTP